MFATFITVIALTSAAGLGELTKAGFDMNKTKKLNQNSVERMEFAAKRLDAMREQCSAALESLGQEKLFVLDNSMKRFLTTFTKLKNVDFRDSLGLEELKGFHIEKKDFEDLQQMTVMARSILAGAAAGSAGGALVAGASYTVAQALACASTGTAISTLGGAAATNATLAFFGGGSIASGGFGMAAGSAVLGGLAVAPAVLVLGAFVGAKAGKALEKAKIDAAEVGNSCETFENASLQCIAIRRRTYMFYSLLARLDSTFMPLIRQMEGIVEKEGEDYAGFSAESRKIIAAAASTAVTIKAVLDAPILSEDGSVTKESEQTVQAISEKIGG